MVHGLIAFIAAVAPAVPTPAVLVGPATGALPLAPTGPDLLVVGPTVAVPLLNAAQFLIPAAVALTALYKLLDHRETGGGFLVEILTKGGGAILMIQLIKAISGLS